MHAANAAASRRHSNVAPGSLVKVNDADVLFVVPRRAARDRRVRRGGVDRERARRGCRVDVAGRVDGAHEERVRAVGQRAERARRGAERIGARGRAGAVEAALEGRAGFRGRERELRRRVRDRAGRAGSRSSCSARVASTVNVRVAGVASTLPAASVARTSNVYAPSASEPRMRGDVQLPRPAVAPVSRRHSNVEPVSLEENVNVAELRRDRAGRTGVDRRVRRRRVDRERARRGRRIGVAGRDGAHREGVASRWPSSCRPAATCTRRTCRCPRACPDGTRTSSPALVDVNVNDADVLFVVPVGPLVIVVSGAAVDTVKRAGRGRRVRVAGGVAGADVERVRAVGERADRARRGAGDVGADRRARAVEAALERRPRLACS